MVTYFGCLTSAIAAGDGGQSMLLLCPRPAPFSPFAFPVFLATLCW